MGIKNARDKNGDEDQQAQVSWSSVGRHLGGRKLAISLQFKSTEK